MNTLKYSRQRAAIKTYLDHTYEHPTADTVYMNVREEFPKISLGTVYRNLNLLASLGEITKIPTNDGVDRFDGNTNPHYHIVCTSCGRVFDLNVNPTFSNSLDQAAQEDFGGTITSHSLLFHGICPDCMKNQ